MKPKELSNYYDIAKLQSEIEAAIREIETDTNDNFLGMDDAKQFVIAELVGGYVGAYQPNYLVDQFKLTSLADIFPYYSTQTSQYSPDIWEDELDEFFGKLADLINKNIVEKIKGPLQYDYSVFFGHWEADGSYCMILLGKPKKDSFDILADAIEEYPDQASENHNNAVAEFALEKDQFLQLKTAIVMGDVAMSKIPNMINCGYEGKVGIVAEWVKEFYNKYKHLTLRNWMSISMFGDKQNEFGLPKGSNNQSHAAKLFAEQKLKDSHLIDLDSPSTAYENDMKADQAIIKMVSHEEIEPRYYDDFIKQYPLLPKELFFPSQEAGDPSAFVPPPIDKIEYQKKIEGEENWYFNETEKYKEHLNSKIEKVIIEESQRYLEWLENRNKPSTFQGIEDAEIIKNAFPEEIIIIVKGGLVQDVIKQEGVNIKVIVKDYDVQDENLVSGTDDNGDYAIIEW